jgi:hypothetical protein
VVHGEQIWGAKEVETQAHQFAAEFLPVSHRDRVRQRLATHRTVPLGQPEQPTKLLDCLASPDSATARVVLPRLLEGIQSASTTRWGQEDRRRRRRQNNRTPGSSVMIVTT